MSNRTSGPVSWAPGVSAHVLDTDEVVVLSEAGRMALRGRPYRLLVPLIDGRRTRENLVAALDGHVDPWVVGYALVRLRHHGHVVERPEPAAGAASDVEVVVAGIPEAAADDLRARLESAGVAPGAALTVVLVDDYLRPELDRTVRAAVAAGRSVLPARPIGRRMWMGPLLGPGSEAIWQLFLRRMDMNRAPDVFVLEHGGALPLVPTDASPAGLEPGLGLTASMCRQVLAGTAPDVLRESVYTYDREGPALQRHPIAHVTDERPPAAPEFGEPLTDPLRLGTVPKRFSGPDGARSATPDETLERLLPLVSTLTGIVSVPAPAPERTAARIFRAKYLQPSGTRPTGRLLAGVSGTVGKGSTEVQAQVSCLAEAVEWHSCSFFGDEPRRRASPAQLGELGIDPQSLTLFSERQIRSGAQGTPGAQPPVVYDRDAVIDWSPCVSLVDGGTRWVPAAHLFLQYHASAPDGDPAHEADSSGCASGNSPEEAVLQGLLELVERDAVALWWHSRARRPGIDLGSFRDPHLDRIAELSDRMGCELRLLDLTTDVGIPTVLAVRWRREDGGHVELGHAAHLDPRAAAHGALNELEQWVSYRPLSLELRAWFATATITEHPHVVPLERPPLGAEELPHARHADFRDDVEHCVRRLAALGHDVLVYDHTRPDVRFPVVRVVVPGLRHVEPRLAPGRLYDVPAALGWVTGRQTEDDLNPVGFPL